MWLYKVTLGIHVHQGQATPLIFRVGWEVHRHNLSWASTPLKNHTPYVTIVSAHFGEESFCGLQLYTFHSFLLHHHSKIWGEVTGWWQLAEAMRAVADLGCHQVHYHGCTLGQTSSGCLAGQEPRTTIIGFPLKVHQSPCTEKVPTGFCFFCPQQTREMHAL